MNRRQRRALSRDQARANPIAPRPARELIQGRKEGVLIREQAYIRFHVNLSWIKQLRIDARLRARAAAGDARAERELRRRLAIRAADPHNRVEEEL